MDSFTLFQAPCSTTSSTLNHGSLDDAALPPIPNEDGSPLSLPVDSEAVGSGDIIGFCVIL
uniref:Pheromone n=1 Tax=Lentinula edodes TaxID=5353 RepID=G8CR06_LENED|nr:pheromone precursor [Lentinula edodes]AGC14658.1 pheromone precursor [Lentinula edodes]AGC14669.1 pheromone precursor [Lentinula edodes]AGL07756.1 pheromone precursor [Lentinula edodes]AWT58006.1 Pheromone [Lentinula edodes]